MVIAPGMHRNSYESHLWWIKMRGNGFIGSSVTKMGAKIVELASIC